MTHAIYPNYESKYGLRHRSRTNQGIAIKTNAKQRYASDVIGVVGFESSKSGTTC